MGCFMGCFGLSSNKKRRTRKILPRHQRICSYEPLHSSDPTDFITNTEKISKPNLRYEEGRKKIRKRVRFDLNVQTYEPIPPPTTTHDNDCCSNDEEGISKGSYKDPSSNISAYPSNYRYQNCVDSFGDEDELGYGESDLEDEDYYTDDDDDNIYEDDADDEDEEEVYGEEHQCLTPLLNPVENLAQWKAVKARPSKVKQAMKENVEETDQAKPLLKEIIVNTSLSNWLDSPKSFHGKRSPIVDITNMEKR